MYQGCSPLQEELKSYLSVSHAQEVAEKSFGIPMFYFKDYLGENLRYNLKNTNVKMVKMSLKMRILSEIPATCEVGHVV